MGEKGEGREKGRERKDFSSFLCFCFCCLLFLLLLLFFLTLGGVGKQPKK